MEKDVMQDKSPSAMRHDEKLSGGGIETMIASESISDTKILAQAFQNKERRDIVVFRQNSEWNGGSVCYVRGTNSATYKGGHLLTPDDPGIWFPGPSLMRHSLKLFGYSLVYDKKNTGVQDPVNCISRHDNGFFFSGFVPNQTVEQQYRFPQGAPLIIGWETELKNGSTTYRFPKAFFEECRIFIEQQEGIISCYEIHSGEKGITRRIGIKGLQNAKVRFYPPANVAPSSIKAYLNAGYPFKNGQIESKKGEQYPGYYHVYEDISGQLIVAW